MQTTVAVINVICALMVVIKGVLFVANEMTTKTFHPFRISWVLITTGALGIVVGPLYGVFVTSFAGTATNIGVTLFAMFERRQK